MSGRLQILFEDEDCLAVVKPAGQFPLGTWAPEGETTLEADFRAYLNPGDPASAYVGIVHRLDRATSGVVLWAKHPKAARRLSGQFEKRTVAKEYWAIAAPAAGALEREIEPVWRDWLTRAHDRGVATAAPAGAPGAREGITRVRRLDAPGLPEGLVWLVLEPETGRTHQLRAQAAARGLPIVGDRAYGSDRSFPREGAIALHARSLSVRHPSLGTLLVVVAALPADWAAWGTPPARS